MGRCVARVIRGSFGRSGLAAVLVAPPVVVGASPQGLLRVR